MNDSIINQILQRYYNICHARLTEIQRGWSAFARRVDTENGPRFLKIFNKSQYTAQSWIKAIDGYMPTVRWLGEHSQLRGQMPLVIPTADGGYKCEEDERLYILYDWIEGETQCDKPPANQQFLELSQIVAKLHCYDERLQIASNVKREGYGIPFFDSLMSRARGGNEYIPREHQQAIADKLNRLSEMSGELSALNLPRVLCHNDIHGWNVIMRRSHPVLIDWEGLRFSPPEADLFMFKYERYWGSRWDEFYEAYKIIRGQYEPNETAMRFFQLRRRLEDIDAFIDTLTYDDASHDVKNARQRIVTECGLLYD